MERIWVARPSISSRTLEEIHGKHGLTADEVRDTVVCRTGLLGRWGASPTTGVARPEIEAEIRSRPVLVVVYPADDVAEDDVWRLGSVYFLDEVGRPPGLAPGSTLAASFALYVGPLPLPPGRYEWRASVAESVQSEFFQVLPTGPAR